MAGPGQDPPEQSGFSGPEFTAQRANPMPPQDIRMPAQAPPDAATPHEMAEDNWSMGTPAAAPGRSRVWLIAAAIAVVFAVVAGFVIFAPKGAEGSPIAYAFEPGQKLNYRMRAQMSGDVSVPGSGSVSIEMQMGGVIRMEVVSVDADGIATVNMKLQDVYVRTDPPGAADVPATIEEQIKVAPDGRIIEGSLGISELGATSQAPPGWDQFSPLLPDGPVAPGDTWSGETEVPFIGGQTITVTSETQLLDYVVEDGKEIAVVKSDIHIPLDVTLSFKELAAEMDADMGELGLPPGADPKFAYEGQMDAQMTARIDPATQELKGTVMNGTMAFDMTVKDMPGLGDVGPAQMDMTMNIVMEQFEGRKPK